VDLQSLITNPIVQTVIALVASFSTAGVIVLLVGVERRRVDTASLLRDDVALSALIDAEPKLSRRARLQRRIRSRMDLAGLDDWPMRRLALVSIIGALVGLLLLEVLNGSAPFMLLGTVGGLSAPWVIMGNIANRRLRLLADQIAAMLGVMTQSAASGAAPDDLLRDVILQGVENPLRWHLAQAMRQIDPRHGLSDASFMDVIIALDRSLHNESFHTTALALHSSVTQGTPVKEMLEEMSKLAHEDLEFRSETIADFAYIRGAALMVLFILPAFITVALHFVMPEKLTLVWNTPAGYLVLGFLILWTGGIYRAVTGAEGAAAALGQGAAKV